MRVKGLALEHNTLTPARAQTQTTRSGVEHTNHNSMSDQDRISCYSIKQTIDENKEMFCFGFFIEK